MSRGTPRTIRAPGLSADVAALRIAALRDRWSLGLMAIAWVHLATFLASHAMYRAGDLAPPRFLLIWFVEMLVVVLLIRRMVTNNGRHPAPPLVGLLARVWITFLILGFSLASTNNLMGMPPEWFKPAWGTLSTFGFAMMAWILSLWFLVPAVQMSLTAMMMARWTPHAYLIYAVSWWIALHLVALALERARKVAISRGEFDPAGSPDLESRRVHASTNGSTERIVADSELSVR
jgi:hypothetical protein